MTEVTPKEAAEIAKLKAETENLQIEGERVRTEVERLKAQAAHFTSEARARAADATYGELRMAQERLTYDRLMSSDLVNGVFRFGIASNDSWGKKISTYVDQESVVALTNELAVYSRMRPYKPIEIVFNSPGGSVTDGMDLFDYIIELRNRGHHVTTVARGMAASMAGILLQAGGPALTDGAEGPSGKRAMGREAYVLIHQISTAIRGKVGDIEDEMIFINMMSDRVLNIFADRAAEAGRNGTASNPITKAQLKRGWNRKDWWLPSDKCLQFGIVDEIR